MYFIYQDESHSEDDEGETDDTTTNTTHDRAGAHRTADLGLNRGSGARANEIVRRRRERVRVRDGRPCESRCGRGL